MKFQCRINGELARKYLLGCANTEYTSQILPNLSLKCVTKYNKNFSCTHLDETAKFEGRMGRYNLADERTVQMNECRNCFAVA